MFWLACKNLQDTVERRGSAYARDVLSCMEVFDAGIAKDQRVQVCWGN